MLLLSIRCSIHRLNISKLIGSKLYMGNFNRGGGYDRDRSGGYGGRGSGSFDRGGSRGGRDFDKPMFSAVCAECGNRCQVPFKPTSNKPVYCNECFHKEDHSEARRPSRPREEENFKYDAQGVKFDKYKQEFEKLNLKLDTIIKSLENRKDGSASKNEPKKIEEVLNDLNLDISKPEKKAKKESKKDSKKEVKTKPEKKAKKTK